MASGLSHNNVARPWRTAAALTLAIVAGSAAGMAFAYVSIVWGPWW